MRYLSCLGLLALLQTSTSALVAQAPRANSPTSSELPRFTLREIVAGYNDTLTRIPGRWLKAALAAMPDSLAMQAYRDAATRSGLAPLPTGLLNSERSRQVMGLYRRSELSAAARSTLAAVREALPSDSTRARFDRLFHPRGEWIVDLHDAALSWARSRVPGIGWDSARRSLAAAHWMPPGDTVPSGEAVPRALYGLAVLAANDSAAFEAVRSDLVKADSVSAAAALLLLSGYTAGRGWYVDVVDFFLSQPWIPDGRDGSSLGDQVRANWRGLGGPGEAASVPEIQTRLFGYPQAVPHYGVPDPLFNRLVRAENPSARAWLEQHGEVGLLLALRSLPAGDSGLLLLQHGDEAIRVTSVPRQARENLNGFLEPRDAIAIDPGYSPLLALGAVVHEWQHLLFRQRQLQAYVASLPAHRNPIIELPWVEPYLAEGFAEWSTEQILQPLAQRWPLLGVGELQKRAGLAQADLNDHHVIGYALVRALAAAVRSRKTTTDLLLRNAEQPWGIVSTPVVARAWRGYGDARDRVVTVPAQRVLIPEVTFTVEDGFPDVITSRILIPPRGRRQH
jgi:hypothetical protein